MGINDAIRAYNGVTNWLNNQENVDLGKPKRKTYRAQDEYLNNILKEFGKEHNLDMYKNNSPKYKGSFSPVMTNCIVIQENWKDFKKWINKNYKRDGTED